MDGWDAALAQARSFIASARGTNPSYALSPRFFLLILPPLLVFLLCEIASDAALSSLGKFPASLLANADDTAAGLENAALLPTVVATWLLLIAFCATAFILFVRDLVRDFSPETIRLCILAFSLCFLTIGLSYAFGQTLGLYKRPGEALSRPIFDQALVIAAYQAGTGTIFNLSVKEMLVSTTTFIGIGATATVLGTLTTLAEQPNADTATRVWPDQTRRIRVYLYLAAGILISGVAFQHAWSTWVGSAIADQTVRTSFLKLVDGYTFLKGVQYSILIASYFAPTSWILSQRDPEIFDTVWKTIKTAAPVIAPLAAGLLPVVFQQIGK